MKVLEQSSSSASKEGIEENQRLLSTSPHIEASSATWKTSRKDHHHSETVKTGKTPDVCGVQIKMALRPYVAQQCKSDNALPLLPTAHLQAKMGRSTWTLTFIVTKIIQPQKKHQYPSHVEHTRKQRRGRYKTRAICDQIIPRLTSPPAQKQGITIEESKRLRYPTSSSAGFWRKYKSIWSSTAGMLKPWDANPLVPNRDYAWVKSTWKPKTHPELFS